MGDEYDEDDLEALAALEAYERSSQGPKASQQGSSAPPPRKAYRSAPPAGLPPPPDIDPDEEEQFYDDEPPPEQMHPDDWGSAPAVSAPNSQPNRGPNGSGVNPNDSLSFGHWANDGTGPSPGRTGQDPQGPAPPIMECPCGAGPCSVLTANTPANPGRQFFKCPKPRGEQCRYFQWVDEAPKDPAASGMRAPDGATAGFGGGGGFGSGSRWSAEGGSWNDPHGDGPQKRKQPEGGPSMDCPCGAGPCAVLTANTAANRGRQFFKCPKPQGEQCRFFQWVDEAGLEKKTFGTGGFASNPGGPGGAWTSPSQGGSGQANTSPGRFGGGGGSWGSPGAKAAPPGGASSCFKCGQDGHWARDCPGAGGGGAAGGYGGGRATQGGGNWSSPGTQSQPGNNGSCFKCGQSGHWSRDCPNQQGGGGFGAGGGSGGRTGGAGGGGSCFKCGQTGHWARDCRA